MKPAYRVLVTDGVSPKGVEILRQAEGFETIESPSLPETELIQAIKGVDALVIRSATKVTRKAIESADKLRVVGRAGVGVDNVDVSAATERGIVVMNTPGGNTISTAEHAFSLLLSLARNIPQAHASVQAGKWERKKFQGVEVFQKTLGIVGMGRIGTEVARRAQAFGMNVLVFDPYLSAAKAKSLQVQLHEKLDDMLPLCDFITLHLPMGGDTRHIIDEKALARCKESARIVNCARGGLVDEAALLKAIESGHILGAALDVYEQEPPPSGYPLLKNERIVATPHLGASTEEAQENVGIEIAETIREFLCTGTIRNAVNMPNVDARTLEMLRPWLDLGQSLGKIVEQMTPSRCASLTVNYSGRIKDQDTSAISRSALRGFLSQAIGPDVNEVNALFFAGNLGLNFTETHIGEEGEFSELMSIRVQGESGDTYEVAATFFGAAPRIVRINGHNLEAKPEGVLLLVENTDRPGIVGWLGTRLGEHNVNIAGMSLSRSKEGERALSVMNLDSAPPQAVLQELERGEGILSIKLAAV
jgi:D-3-phosphoglycerate dehydrogenase